MHFAQEQPIVNGYSVLTHELASSGGMGFGAYFSYPIVSFLINSG